MLKKLLVIGGLVLVVSWACGNNVFKEIGSYVKTGLKEIRGAAKSNISIGFEIKRAEGMLSSLEKADDRLIASLASEIQVLRRTESEIENLQANLEVRKQELQMLNDKVKHYTGSDLRKEQEVVELERKFSAYKKSEMFLKAKIEAQARHKERMEMIKEQREALKQQRVELASRLEKLKTDLEILKLAEARSKHGVKEEQIEELNQLKSLVDGLEERVERQMIELELRKDQEAKPASGTKASSGNTVMTDIDGYFGNKEEKAAAAKK